MNRAGPARGASAASRHRGEARTGRGLTVVTRHGTIAPIPDPYVADGHLDIAYASTIHAAQGATVDETHTLATDTMGADALYVAMTRGRHSNHVHLHPPIYEPDRQHGPLRAPSEPWTARQALVDICLDDRDSQDTAIARRRELRRLNIDPAEHDRRRLANIDASISLAAAVGHGAHQTVPPSKRRGQEIAHPQPVASAVDSTNAQLRADLARLRAPSLNRPDDGIGLGL